MPFLTYNGCILLNPGERERYPLLLATSINSLIEEGRLKKEEVVVLYLSDKCLRDELRIDLHIA